MYYCLSIHTSPSNICKLQGVKNFAACIVSGSRKFNHISLALKNLTWIPVDPLLSRKYQEYFWYIHDFIDNSQTIYMGMENKIHHYYQYIDRASKKKKVRLQRTSHLFQKKIANITISIIYANCFIKIICYKWPIELGKKKC